VNALDRRRDITATLGPVQQRRKVLLQVLAVVADTLPVHPRRTPGSHAVVGFRQPLDIQIVVQCRQPFRRTLPGYLRYPLLFRVHVFGSLRILHVSSQRFRDCAGPFPTPWLRAAPFASFLRYYEPAKTPVTLLPALPLSVAPRYLGLASRLRSAPPGNRSGTAWMLITGASIPVFDPKDANGSPMFPGGTPWCLCRTLRPRPDLGTLPLAALRCCPRRSDYEGSSDNHYFEAQSHGFSTGCLRFVPPLLATTQNSLPGVANLSRVGLDTH
jgi:hypothetical protein